MRRKSQVKPRVGILGAGFPALVLAHTLRRTCEVEIFGRPEEAGVLSAMGPRHLWVVPGLDSSAYPNLAACGEIDAGVAFIEADDTIRVVRIDEAAGTHLPHWTGYWAKVNGVPQGKPPCQGRASYRFYVDGFHALVADLADTIAAVNRAEITSVYGEPGGTFAVAATVGTFTGYDALVTTLRPDAFAMLATQRCGPLYYGPPPFPRSVYFSWSDTPPSAIMRRLDPKRADSQMLVYSGRASDEWHRCSSTPKGWCYEFAAAPSAAAILALRIGPPICAPTRVSGGLTPFTYHGKIIPVGRYAEWDQELMVSDVLANVGRYVEEVHRAIAA